jgi:hypothetical protein
MDSLLSKQHKTYYVVCLIIQFPGKTIGFCTYEKDYP